MRVYYNKQVWLSGVVLLRLKIMCVNVRTKAPVGHFIIIFPEGNGWEDGNKPLFAQSKLIIIKEEDQ